MRLHGDRRVPEAGAEIVGRIYPNGRFAWVIRTGAAINRETLAAHCTDAIVNAAFVRATDLLRAHQQRNPSDPLVPTSKLVAKFITVAARALRTKEAVEGNAYPKGSERIAGEALILRAILITAAAAGRTS